MMLPSLRRLVVLAWVFSATTVFAAPPSVSPPQSNPRSPTNQPATRPPYERAFDPTDVQETQTWLRHIANEFAPLNSPNEVAAVQKQLDTIGKPAVVWVLPIHTFNFAGDPVHRDGRDKIVKNGYVTFQGLGWKAGIINRNGDRVMGFNGRIQFFGSVTDKPDPRWDLWQWGIPIKTEAEEDLLRKAIKYGKGRNRANNKHLLRLYANVHRIVYSYQRQGGYLFNVYLTNMSIIPPDPSAALKNNKLTPSKQSPGEKDPIPVSPPIKP